MGPDAVAVQPTSLPTPTSTSTPSSTSLSTSVMIPQRCVLCYLSFVFEHHNIDLFDHKYSFDLHHMRRLFQQHTDFHFSLYKHFHFEHHPHPSFSTAPRTTRCE
eukprot:4391092-Amphidinium_carterae.3